MGLLKNRSRTRPITLSPGDKLMLHTDTGSLMLHTVDGKLIDLNQLVMDSGCTDAGRGINTILNPLLFVHMCSIVAVTHGLTANDVTFDGSMFEPGTQFICVLK